MKILFLMQGMRLLFRDKGKETRDMEDMCEVPLLISNPRFKPAYRRQAGG